MPSSSSSSSSSPSIHVVSKFTVYPESKSNLKSLKLSVSDLPMLSCQYIQKGVLLSQPPFESAALIYLLKNSLSKTLSHFPALAGRLQTDSDGHVHILCNDAGVLFVHAKSDIVTAHSDDQGADDDIPAYFRKFFQFDNTLSYAGHSKPIVAVQVTELRDGVFIGCTVNHAVVDGTSFWNFFNTFAEVCKLKGPKKISKSPDFSRDTVFNSPAVLQFPAGGPSATFSGDEPLREKIFHFSRESILKLKLRANDKQPEISGKIRNDNWAAANGKPNGKIAPVTEFRSEKKPTDEISSFQSLSAQLWRSVTRARNLEQNKTTTFRMAVNCRHRVDPRLHPLYFGNAIQSIPTVASAGELLSNDLRWGAYRLHRNVVAHDDATVRRGIKDWESNPRLFPLGNFDGAMITMGSSPRFPMYDNDFGWGRPVAVRSGRANKFDGKISAFPGSEGNGSVDLEVVLAPETMAALEKDMEFMQYVSS
ncbi:OLC1v1035050C1 [Oldenlandia corymbosa var. corymbosa]|uniref:OLC1v1035050C1 n=1 Tax=Oldenlandia corymbosa var. corymbosa TaxID=529605 RepID=A0AAV1CRZ8_OLDCO|nr:OLC1v1035050C1 [Oldenlandia corymbosa var. corymbosa]